MNRVIRMIGATLLFVFLAGFSLMAEAQQSTIVEAEDRACMGYDKSRSQTEREALANAKRKAAELAATYLTSETTVKDFQLEKDLVNAYATATVRVIEEGFRTWYDDPAMGSCCKIKIKAEVIPDGTAMKRINETKDFSQDPTAPLTVKVWTDKPAYKQGEKIRVFLKGNKPFYARVHYRDAANTLLQLLPNPYRRDNYFLGGVVYDIPSGNDRFELRVGPPFGAEQIVVYASSSPQGNLSLLENGGVYQVRTSADDVSVATRGVSIVPSTKSDSPQGAEFSEAAADLRTGQ
ncbi:MAG: DUF4384 domain-containing protein [Deltaproteobacteria bacterium]|nr:DUF4384 domain-containing protein [Deltaproteobacteria bacterium]